MTAPPHPPRSAEHRRLAEATGRAEDDLFAANPWYEWGPYLAERAWGTVREDYSANGDAWASFPHDHARSRAYRWNEDGMAGISDIHHELCLALALWNGVDPILKERMFGLSGPQGNHGEDAKECWWYLDGLPSHALLRWRYHYPQAAFPYERLVDESARRTRDDLEPELLDTGIFDDDRYWAVEVTYAKADPTDVLMVVTVENKGPDPATLHVLPTLWFRNTWRWSGADDVPALVLDGEAVLVEHPRLGGYRFDSSPGPGGGAAAALFCDNESNMPRLFGSAPITPHPKDGINDHVVGGAPTVNPEGRGTKAAWWHQLHVEPGGVATIRLRLRGPGAAAADAPPVGEWGSRFDALVDRRRSEADEFYAAIAPSTLDDERRRILRQACAGLVWSKQMYIYRVSRWLDGDPAEPPPPPAHRTGRNSGWRHLDAFDVLAMPDPWEYPWFAAWDLAFHAVAWAHLDPAFAKYQIIVLLREWFLHPNGALPSYEWDFNDVNPPVHALAALRVYAIDGGRDGEFLERVFQKLLLNFTWWLNRQDPHGRNVFGGGFLGLDNISPLDRSHLPPGFELEQADGTAWVGYFSVAMLMLSVALAEHDRVYDDMVVKFVEQTMLITEAFDAAALFDVDDGFFYDRLVTPTGEVCPIKVQTLVGMLPALPAVVIDERASALVGRLRKRFARIVDERGRPLADWRVKHTERGQQVLVSVIPPDQLRRVLTTLFDEEAFLSPYGLRSMAKRQAGYQVPGIPGAVIDYEPAESRSAMYGGNSNWRGPVWFPVNYLTIRALLKYDEFFGEALMVEYPSGSGEERRLGDIARDLADRLVSIWLPDAEGRRPVWGQVERFQRDPAWRDNLWFFEYFHGDVGAGLGASHQTGWTALVADLLLDPPGGS